MAEFGGAGGRRIGVYAQPVAGTRNDIKMSITELTQPVFSAFDRAVLDFFRCTVFPRCARKNRTQMIGKYHAAAGRRDFKRGSRVLAQPRVALVALLADLASRDSRAHSTIRL